MFKRKLHDVSGIERPVRFQSEALQEVRVAALPRDTGLGSVNLPPGQDLNLWSDYVKARDAIDDGAVT